MKQPDIVEKYTTDLMLKVNTDKFESMLFGPPVGSASVTLEKTVNFSE